MRRPALALGCVAAACALTVSAGAAPPGGCEAPDHITHVEGRLPKVAAAAARHRLDVLVVGTGSSTLTGPEGAKSAYPARLEAALASKLPGVAVKVATDVRSRRSAADMAKTFAGLAGPAQPTLVVWQTGTVEAIRGIDPDDFRSQLEKAVVRLQAAGIDVVLVNMQYSLRMQAMISVGPYAEAMRWVAQQHDIPLFDRLSLMKHWSDAGTFDLSGSDGAVTAVRVHDCIGSLLADLILDAAGLKAAKPKEKP